MTRPGHTLRFMATAEERAAYNRKYYERGGAALIRIATEDGRGSGFMRVWRS